MKSSKKNKVSINPFIEKNQKTEAKILKFLERYHLMYPNEEAWYSAADILRFYHSTYGKDAVVVFQSEKQNPRGGYGIYFWRKGRLIDKDGKPF